MATGTIHSRRHFVRHSAIQRPPITIDPKAAAGMAGKAAIEPDRLAVEWAIHSNRSIERAVSRSDSRLRPIAARRDCSRGPNHALMRGCSCSAMIAATAANESWKLDQQRGDAGSDDRNLGA